MSQGIQLMVSSPPLAAPAPVKCLNPCESVFSSLNDGYSNPFALQCNYVGISGWNGKNYCIKFDQDYGSSSACHGCIGCVKDCGNAVICPFGGCCC